jgi:heme-degrading monooxygenase HmoA
MSFMLVRHTVDDYAKWKPLFDEHGAAREASGFKGGYLLRSAENPNELFLLLQTEDLDQARRFAQSDDLRQTMQRAGVSGAPEIFFLEEIERVQR